ncbi:MAG: restriction endonuclease subunit S [Spirochaetaceae bacterium]|nr:restriction endonuclease subunit S [Spirochaetaceae bacterium]
METEKCEYKSFLFSDVLKIVNGKNQRAVEDKNGPFPIYGSGGIMGYATDYLCPENTVIIGRKGSINKPIFVKQKFWNVDTAFGLVADEELLQAKYLYYFCEHFDFERLNKAVTIPSLTKADLLQIQIFLPPIENQKQITAVLDKCTELIAKYKQMLEKYDTLIKSRFIEMFGDPVHNPMKWEVKKLKTCTSKIGSGATPKGGRESYISEGIALVRSMNVYKGYFEFDGLAHITEEQAKELDNVTLQENDVLINITGASVARCCILPSEILPARVNQHVSILRAKDDLHPVYLCNLLISDPEQRVLLDIGGSGGATREAITKTELEELEIPVPPIELQCDFAAFVQQIDKSKSAVQKSLEKAETLYKSLMQTYFG